MIKQSVKKPFAILVAVIVVMMLAAVSLTRMTTDLLPTISTPYMMVITTYPGASPERVEMDVTEPLEGVLSTVTGVENFSSSSAENYSMIMLEFEESTDMDSALVKVNTAIDTVEGSLPDLCSTPSLMEISMDMMATMYVAVDRDDMDIYQLTDYVNDTLSPYLQRRSGVASVSPLGLVEESVEIRLNQEKVDEVNRRLSRTVEDQLAEAEAELEDAQAEIDDGKAQLDSGESQLAAAQQSTSQQLGEATRQMNEALATQSAYSAILTSQQANRTALETELQAYEDAGIQAGYDELNSMFATLADSSYDAIYPTVWQRIYDETYQQTIAVGMDEESAASAATLAADTTADALTRVQVASLAATLPTGVEDAIANPDKLAAAVDLLNQAGQSEAAARLTVENLQQMSAIVNERIPAIHAELGNLQTEMAANQAVLDSVNQAVGAAMDNYAQLEAGKITAAASFGATQAQITSGRQALENAQAQLDEAAESFEEARANALETANLNQLVTMDTLSSLIYAQNFTMPAGYIDDGDDNQWLLKVGDEYESVADLESLVLTNLEDIGDITLGDVADITVIDNSADSYARMNGRDAVLLSIYKSSTAGTSAVSKDCNAAIAALMEEDEHLNITVLMDQGEYIELFISSIMSNMIFGALLAVLVLALFLRSVKPTLVVAFSIPFSVLVAALVMYFSGITLNMMSMSGLALGIGMLVDNSIVVIENIYRLRGRGYPAARAAVQGAKQVAGAIISSTLTTICVFLPMIFTTGMVRELMIPFALTISYALIASLVVALSVAPTMSSVLLRNAAPKEDKLFARVQKGYGRALDFCLRRKYVPLGVAVVLLAFSIYQVSRMGIVLMPEMNSDQLYLQVTMDEDLSMEDCYAKADDITARLLEVDGVESVGAMTNLSGVISTSMADTGNDYFHYTYYLVLDESIDKSGEVEAVSDRVSAALAGVDRCTADLSESSAGDMSAMLPSGLSVKLYGRDSETLNQISRDLMAMAEEIEGFTDVSNGQEDGDEVIHLVVDKDDAMRYGLTVAQIYSGISGRLTTEKAATTITVDGQEMEVVIVDENHLLTVENLMDMEFETTTTDGEGNSVTETHTLGEFAHTETAQGLATVTRENGTHTMTVTAATEEGYNTTRLSQQFQEKLAAYPMPEGYSAELSGEVEEVADMMTQMIRLLLLGGVLVYLVMVAQFQSLLSPFIILFTVPLAFTGGLIGMLISGDQISIVTLLGFLVLLGTVVNNGIVFVDYTNQLRKGGMGKREALIATGKTRMRPILMTALTTILSMSTMMFSQDMTANMSRGMAVVVAGGLAYATLMTLFVVPVMYDILYRRQPKDVDVGDGLDDAPDDAAEYLAQAGRSGAEE